MAEAKAKAKAKAVGLIGIGLIGTALARRLLGAGLTVVGFDVDAAKRVHLEHLGGRATTSVAEIARECRRIVLAVFDTDQVEEVVSALAGSGNRQVLCTSTCDPERIAELAKRVVPNGITLLEVPLSGTSEQIAHGDGVGLIGGDQEAIDQVADVLDAICPRRYYLGAIGNGGKAKLAVNLILGVNRAALAEGLVFAERLGLDPRAFLEVARGSAAYSQIMDIKGEKMLSGDFAAHGKVTQSLKDALLMLEYGKRAGQALPLLRVHASLLEGCSSHGEGEWDNCAIIQQIRRLRAPTPEIK